MKAERHALFVLATCLVLGVGVVDASTSASCASAATNARWSLRAAGRRMTCGCRVTASPGGWSHGSGVSSSAARRATLVRVRGGAVKSDQYNARMQVMITRNMRKVLVDELDYLPDEVDDMDPQIAAVVIEKSLPRPRAGMPIAWRRSIRQTGSSGPPNPFRYLTDAIQATLEGAVKGGVAVVAFPFVAAGRAAGALQRGGVTGVAALALCLGVVAALVTSGSEAAPGEGGADDLSPSAAGLQALGANLAAARTMLLSRGRERGNGGDASSETSPTGREPRGGSEGGGGDGGGDGGAKKEAAGAAGKAGGRRADTEEQKAPKAGGNKIIRDDVGSSSSSSSSSGRRRNADEKSRDSAASQRHLGRDDDGDGVDGDEWRYSSGRDQRGGFSSKKKPKKPKRRSAQLLEENDLDDFGRQSRGGAPQKKQTRAFGTTRGEVPRERSSATAAETRGSRTGTGAGDVGEGKPKSQRPKKYEKKRRRRAENDGEEVCPDAPVSPNAGGAVWFEDLPPAPPAPDTIGVLDEEEEEGLLRLGADHDRRPRWGRKPMSEHIPSEEEMETWDSKIEASDTWLDRGINKAMGSLFGGGGEGDSEK